MKRTRPKKLLVIALLVVFVCVACASRLPDRQSNAVATLVALDKVDWAVLTPDGRFDASSGAEKLLHFVANTRDGQYQIIPLQELKSRHYEAGLLPKLLKRGA